MQRVHGVCKACKASEVCKACKVCSGCEACNGCNACKVCKACNGCNGCNGCNACEACKACNGCNGCNGCNACKACKAHEAVLLRGEGRAVLVQMGGGRCSAWGAVRVVQGVQSVQNGRRRGAAVAESCVQLWGNGVRGATHGALRSARTWGAQLGVCGARSAVHRLQGTACICGARCELCTGL